MQAAVLFGSQARRDADWKSDTDIAIFAHSETMEEMIETKRLLSVNGTAQTSISLYSVRSAEVMAAEGSLFLWHLKIEGSLLYARSPWLSVVLDGLNSYSEKKARLDLKTLRIVLSDIETGLALGEQTLEFEAATLYSVLRTMGMIVSMLHRSPCFGRLQPIYAMNRSLPQGLRMNELDLNELLSARLAYSRGLSVQVNSKAARSLYAALCRMGAMIVEHLLEKCIE